tara:strand:+ start:10572 stop:13661 length:3090 start_codon:yes stop_codon:yes gene_type:complete
MPKVRLWRLLPVSAFVASSILNPVWAETVRYSQDIRPLLSKNCLECHGPDSHARKADLRLDLAIDQHVAEEVLTRIFSTDPDEVMPPPQSAKTLSAEEQGLLKTWIEEGATWEGHWSFQPIARPEVPETEASRRWAKNPIDHFVHARLASRGLEPNPEASLHEFARRASLDLVGLPPTWSRVEDYILDLRENAPELYVDELLKSPHAAEHQTRFWLDAARYGDTHGMHLDNYREIWPYRDWVIQAFRDNMPFDRFTIEQLAGDLLPNATLQQKIATGFNRCNITTSEGGAIPEEVNVRYMIDRVETTSTVFLGLTTGCAVCHDHKFDPVSQRDFYQLGAFFNNTTQPAMDGNQKDSPPVIVLPKDEFKEEWAELQVIRDEAANRMMTDEAVVKTWWGMSVGAVDRPIRSANLSLWLPLHERESELPKGAQWAKDHPAGKRGMRFEKGASLEAELVGPSRTDAPLSISFWLRTPDQLVNTTLFDQTTKTEDGKLLGWKITTSTQGALTFQLHDGAGKSIKGLLPGEEALSPREWSHVCVRYSGGLANSAVSILVNGASRNLRNSTELTIEPAQLSNVPLKVAPSLPTGGMSDIRIYRRWLNNEEVMLLADEFELRELLDRRIAWAELEEEPKQLAMAYHNQVIDPQFGAAARKVAETQTRRDFIYARSVTSLVSEERANHQPRAWVLQRGEYDQRGEEVGPGVPAVLPGMSQESPKNRLGLAKWLVQPENPLTARVTVNRLWQSIFGTGLVATAEDFGATGSPPTHPELLDWLAMEFVESGWNVNHILKLLVTSATYRQSPKITPEKLAADPDNRYFSRGTRIRLDAEVIRDQALAVSGLLVPTIGGPSVKPYQPPGVWKPVAFAGSNTREFRQDTGDSLYRRSLYTFWKKTSPPTSMAAFDAPSRESCVVRRERTNTPMQALVLMNDPQFVEAARHLAVKAMRVVDDDFYRAAWMMRTVFTRPADARDLDALKVAAAKFREHFRNAPEEAKALVEVGDSEVTEDFEITEIATWTMIANIVMNRDDFLCK